MKWIQVEYNEGEYEGYGGNDGGSRYGNNMADVTMEEVIAAAKSANIHNFVTALPAGYETNVRTVTRKTRLLSCGFFFNTTPHTVQISFLLLY